MSEDEICIEIAKHEAAFTRWLKNPKTGMLPALLAEAETENRAMQAAFVRE